MPFTYVVKSSGYPGVPKKNYGTVTIDPGETGVSNMSPVVAATGDLKRDFEAGTLTTYYDLLRLTQSGTKVMSLKGKGRPERPDIQRRPIKKESDMAGNGDNIDLMADGEISKIDKAEQNVFGWAYVTHDTEGNVNIDKSGDFVDAVEEIEKSAYNFVLNSRQGDAMHTNVKSSTMIESMVFTPAKIEKMGLPQGSVPLGWWLGFHVEDPDVWDRVEKGELVSFSVHGKGVRSKVAD